MLRPDPLGLLDLAVGILMLYTISPVPAIIATIHAYFLIGKGIGSMINIPIFPLPVFILGGAADIISAAILYTGQPPLIGPGIQEILAMILFLKGVLTLITMMG